MHFNERQRNIVELLQKESPLTTDSMAKVFQVSRSSLQADLAMLLAWGVLEQQPFKGYSFCTDYNDEKAFRERVGHLRVRDFMRLPVSVKEECSIQEALVALFTYDVASLIVVGESQELKGIVSRKDFLRASLGKIEFQKVPVNVIMTRMPNIVMVLPDERVVDAASKLVKHAIDTIPVVEIYLEADGNELYHVIGSFTKTGVASVFVDLTS
ncbi:MAG: CBS domain-containing protein [Peptococcaceae bacterium]|nr:CBS domain-containing protein [Peptococcaceae bacterium]